MCTLLLIRRVNTYKHASINRATPMMSSCHMKKKKKKKNHYIFSSHLRAGQMPGPPREGQLMCTLFLSVRQ